ncbi:MAG: hypothetical protein MJ211_13195 [Bacteroidales bacterium]|nr:hypothetical protein [Bacteroidales bacterium]
MINFAENKRILVNTMSFTFFAYKKGRKITLENNSDVIYYPIYLRVVINRQSYELSFSKYLCDKITMPFSDNIFTNENGINLLNGEKITNILYFINEFKYKAPIKESYKILKISEKFKNTLSNIIKFFEISTNKTFYFKEIPLFSYFIEWFDNNVKDFFLKNMEDMLFFNIYDKLNNKEKLFFNLVDVTENTYQMCKNYFNELFEYDIDVFFGEIGLQWKHICIYIENKKISNISFLQWYFNNYDNKDEIINKCIDNIKQLLVFKLK